MLIEILTDFFDFNGVNKRYSAANSVLVRQIRSICTIIVHFPFSIFNLSKQPNHYYELSHLS